MSLEFGHGVRTLESYIVVYILIDSQEDIPDQNVVLHISLKINYVYNLKNFIINLHFYLHHRFSYTFFVDHLQHGIQKLAKHITILSHGRI